MPDNKNLLNFDDLADVFAQLNDIEDTPEELTEEEKASQRRYEETIKKRLTVYHSQTAPLIDWYKKEGKYQHINGLGNLETITQDICKAVDAVK